MQVSQLYQSMFTPATYAFAVWGVIGVAFFIYAIYQLLPAQSNEVLYDRLAKPLVLANLASMAWIVSFRMNIIYLSVAFIFITLIAALMMYTRVRHTVLRDDCSNWVSVPFSLLAGWLSVAAVGNVAILLISLGWQGTTFNQTVWTIAMIVGCGMLGIWACFRCRDYIFPSVVSWACIAIFVAHHAEYPYLGVVALVTAALPIIWIATTLIKRVSYRQRVWANKLSF